MNMNLTEIIVILDRSGSMMSTKTDAEGGFNAFVAEQKKLPGAVLSLYQFDNEYEIVYENKELKDVPPLNLVPRGSTALFDAVGRTLNTVGTRLSNTDENKRPGKVIVVIITDGMENASREFTAEKIKAMVEHQTSKYNWQFVYIGANQDAITVGTSIGVTAAASINYANTTKGTRNSYAVVAANILRSRQMDEAIVFSAEDRKMAMDTSN